MKKTILIALAGTMIVAFMQCNRSSKAYKDAMTYLKSHETAIEKIDNCDELDVIMPEFLERAEIMLRKVDDPKDETMTEKEKTLIKETIEKLIETSIKKADMLGCVDRGITRRLPPVAETSEEYKVKERNLMTVVIDSKDSLLVNGQPFELSQLKDEVIKFMTPHPNDSTAPEVETKKIPVGDKSYIEVVSSKGIISFQNANNTSYEMYIKVQDQLALAFNELRNREAINQFKKDYSKLNEAQTKAIKEAVPVRISETELIKKQQ